MVQRGYERSLMKRTEMVMNTYVVSGWELEAAFLPLNSSMQGLPQAFLHWFVPQITLGTEQGPSARSTVIESSADCPPNE